MKKKVPERLYKADDRCMYYFSSQWIYDLTSTPDCSTKPTPCATTTCRPPPVCHASGTAPPGASWLGTSVRRDTVKRVLVVLVWPCFIEPFASHGLIETIYGATEMWNCYRASDHQRDIKCIEELGPGNARGYALFDVISYAVVAAQH